MFILFNCLSSIKIPLGLITGFYNNPYSLKFFDIVKNVVPVLVIIVLEEFCRFTINQRSGRNRFILVANILLFTFVDFAIRNSFVDIRSLEPFLKLFTTTFMQCLFMNIGLTVISYKHGLKTALIYSCIFNLYGYVIPIIPGFSKYVETVVDMLIPIIIMLLLHIGVPDIFKKNKKNKEDIRNKHIVTKITGVVLFIIVIAMVCLNSNIFRFWVCVVGSGSMDPTIKIGDLIVVDKSYSTRYNELNNGDVIVFNISGKYYTHRIIEVIENNGEKSFITKGDRDGQAVDDWLVTKNEIVGKTDFKFSYLGLPSIWLRDLVKEK